MKRAVVVVALALSGCGASHEPIAHSRILTPIPSALIREARPIGAGPRYEPKIRGHPAGPCRSGLGPRYGVHVELFAANRVVLVPAGIGTVPPRTTVEGRISGARCYGALVTVDPTGVVLVRPGAAATLGELFAVWGQPLSNNRLASFRSSSAITAFLDGRRWRGKPGDVPLTRHAEIVIEVGPFVPPHQSYDFPPGI